MFRDASPKLLALLITYFLLPQLCAYPEDEGCVNIKECPAALNHVKNVKTDRSSMKILRMAHCGFDGREPFVKCDTIPDLPRTPSENGCVRLQDCPKALGMIRVGIYDPVVVNLFRSVHCGTKKSHPLVYCHKLGLH